MTLRKLASEIAKREGKKSQAKIGDIREMINVLCEAIADDLTSDMCGDDILNIEEFIDNDVTLLELKKKIRSRSKKLIRGK